MKISLFELYLIPYPDIVHTRTTFCTNIDIPILMASRAFELINIYLLDEKVIGAPYPHCRCIHHIHLVAASAGFGNLFQIILVNHLVTVIKAPLKQVWVANIWHTIAIKRYSQYRKDMARCAWRTAERSRSTTAKRGETTPTCMTNTSTRHSLWTRMTRKHANTDSESGPSLNCLRLKEGGLNSIV